MKVTEKPNKETEEATLPKRRWYQNKITIITIIAFVIMASSLLLTGILIKNSENKLGEFDTLEALEATYPNGIDTNGFYEVGKLKYYWDGNNKQWSSEENITLIKGENGENGSDGTDGTDGLDGINGNDGLSAYELDVKNGYTGTLDEWLNDIQGKDFYEYLKENGYAGTFEEWAESLKGKDGEDGSDGADGINGTNGDDGTDGKDGTNGINGKDGKSAYELAVKNGFTGTEDEWLRTLSPYEMAKYLNPKITCEADYVESLTPYGVYKYNLPDGETLLTKEEWLESLTEYGIYKYCLEDPSTAMSKSDWLLSKTEFGKAKLEALANGKDITEEEYQQSLTAYGSYLKTTLDIPVKSEEEWLLSLQGERGEDGAPGSGAGGAYDESIGNLFDLTDPVPIGYTPVIEFICNENDYGATLMEYEEYEESHCKNITKMVYKRLGIPKGICSTSARIILQAKCQLSSDGGYYVVGAIAPNYNYVTTWEKGTRVGPYGDYIDWVKYYHKQDSAKKYMAYIG